MLNQIVWLIRIPSTFGGFLLLAHVQLNIQSYVFVWIGLAIGILFATAPALVVAGARLRSISLPTAHKAEPLKQPRKMSIWDFQKLGIELESGEVEEKEQFTYLITLAIAGLVVTNPYMSSLLHSPDKNELDVYMMISTVAISAAGLLFCYSASSPDTHSTGFIARLICLSVPIGVRIVVLAYLVKYLATVAVPIFSDSYDPGIISNETKPVDLIFSQITLLAFYCYLRHALRMSYQSREAIND